MGLLAAELAGAPVDSGLASGRTVLISPLALNDRSIGQLRVASAKICETMLGDLAKSKNNFHRTRVTVNVRFLSAQVDVVHVLGCALVFAHVQFWLEAG